MDINQSNKHNFQSLKEFSRLRVQRKKTITILLFSLSLFSVLYFFSSYFSVYHHLKSSLDVFLSYYSTDKKYIFLLCNGILAFLITKSGMMGKSPSILSPFVGNIDSTENRIREFRRTEVFEFPTARIVTEKVVMEEVDQGNEVNENGVLGVVCEDDELDQETLHKFEENQEDEDEGDEDKEVEDDDEEEEEGGIKFLISLVELNGKCDNFIKMMREGIKI